MPKCWLTKVVPLANGQHIPAGSPAVLLREGDRWCVIDPSNDNVLIGGMTQQFLDLLKSKGFITVEES